MLTLNLFERRALRLPLLSALLLCGASTIAHARLTDLPPPEIDTVESRYQAGEYQALLGLIDADAPANLMAFRLKSLIKLEREDEAEDELTAWLTANAMASTSARAQGLKMAGDIYANMAMRASVFSAPGLASKSLEHYQGAQQLAPGDMEIAKALFGFYLHAPGIVGGDENKAREVALNIAAISPLEGQLALLDVALKQEDNKTFDAQLAEARKAFRTDRQLSLRHSVRMGDDHEKAAAVLSEAIGWGKQPDEDAELDPQLRYQLLKHAVKGGVYLKEASEGMEPLFANLPDKYRPWAQLRRAQLLALMGDKTSARTWLDSAAQIAPDDKAFSKEVKALKKQL